MQQSKPLQNAVYSLNELVARAKLGDSEALASVFESCKPLVRAQAARFFIAGGDRDDVLQEGMIGLFKAIGDFDPQKGVPFAGFASLCISRQIQSAVKAASRKKNRPLNSYISFDKPVSADGREGADPLLAEVSGYVVEDPSNLLIDREHLAALPGIIAECLTDLERTVFSYYLDGYGNIDIAKLIDKPVKSVENALQRVKKKLSKRL